MTVSILACQVLGPAIPGVYSVSVTALSATLRQSGWPEGGGRLRLVRSGRLATFHMKVSNVVLRYNMLLCLLFAYEARGGIMLRKMCALLVASAMALAVAGCGAAGQASEGSASSDAGGATTLAGGWELYDNESVALPGDARAAFQKAAKTFTGGALTPVAYVASQVVAGTNHMILCEAETTNAESAKSYQMVVVYADPAGGAEISHVTKFDLGAYTTDDGSAANADAGAGGWQVPEETTSVAIPDSARRAFESAATQLSGNNLEPMALLGTQVVAGKNYAFLCHSTLVTQEPVTSVQVVTVYEDLNGNAKVTGICLVNPADFNG